MPRPPRCRRVCSLPAARAFGPADGSKPSETVVMGIDEYEVIRLIDWAGLTQEQCAAQINVARTTVTGIYDSARRKLADALIHGKGLVITGGHIKVCERSGTCCHHGCCCAGKLKNTKEIDPNE